MGFSRYVKNLVLAGNAWLVRDNGPKIIFYHDVVGERAYSYMSTPFKLFSAHMMALSEMGIRITEEIPVKEKEVMVCFDDGLRGIWDRRDYFFSHNLHPTVSLAVALVGSPNYLAWKEIRELKEAGFRFVSHTWSHRSLTDCSDDELEHELRDSRSELSEQLGREINEVCFPRGRFSVKILESSIAAGYKVGYTSIPGNVGSNVIQVPARGIQLLARNLVQDFGVGAFRHVLRGGMNPLRNRYLHLQFEGSL